MKVIKIKKRKEGNILFNDDSDHSDRERKPAAATWATLSDLQQGFFYMHHPTDRVAHTVAFVTPVAEHWMEREIIKKRVETAKWEGQKGWT